MGVIDRLSKARREIGCPFVFDHEKLDVYGLELQFVAWTADFLEEVSHDKSSFG